MSSFFKMREALADRIPSMQYQKPQTTPRAPFFKHQMPFWKRYLLVLFACFAIPLGLLLLFGVGLVAWAIITS
jgi:hypothetical protein